MEQEIEYEQFAQPEAAALDGEVDLSRVGDIPMELSVEIGRTQMTVGETLSLRAGSIVTLDRLAGDAVDLLVNGTPIARGEVVVVDEKFGLRVQEILEGGDATAERSEADGGAAALAPSPAAVSAGAGGAPLTGGGVAMPSGGMAMQAGVAAGAQAGAVAMPAGGAQMQPGTPPIQAGEEMSMQAGGGGTGGGGTMQSGSAPMQGGLSAPGAGGAGASL